MISKKNITLIALILIILSLVFCNRKVDNSYKKEIRRLNDSIAIYNDRIQIIINNMKIDSIEYEKQKEHIKDLRSRYPNDALLDSLFKSGQSID